MPDPITDSEDTRVAAQAGEEASQAPVQDTDTAQAQPKMWADKYADPEKLEEAYRHLREETTRAEQKAAELARQNQELQNEVLKKLASASEERQTMSPAQEAAQLEKLAEETGLDEKALVYFGNRLADVQEATKTATQAELKALKDELEAAKVELRSSLEEKDPAYQQNKELVDKMVDEAGISRSAAMKVLKVVPRGPEIEAGAASPGGIGNGTVAPSSSGTEQSSEDVVKEFLRIVPDATEEEIAAVRKKGVGLQSRTDWSLGGEA